MYRSAVHLFCFTTPNGKHIEQNLPSPIDCPRRAYSHYRQHSVSKHRPHPGRHNHRYAILGTGHADTAIFPRPGTPHTEQRQCTTVTCRRKNRRHRQANRPLPPTLRISIKTGILNIHSNRSPIDGNIESIEYRPGGQRKTSPAATANNIEHNAVLVKTKHGHALSIVQMANTLTGRIFCYPRAGDKLKRGQRYGFISLGAKVDVYLPLDAKVCVSIGDKVSVTATILAELR